MPDAPATLLCVANFPTNVGYAWDHIERLFGRIADHLAAHDIRTLVAYPAMDAPPRTIAGTAATPIVLDASLATPESVRAVCELARRERVRTIYLTDRPVRSGAYLRLRRAGVRHIVVHDRTSGARMTPRGVRRAAKWLLARVPGMGADTVITVSDYVARRQVEVAMVPPRRVVRVHNTVPIPPTVPTPNGEVQRALGIAPDRPLVVATSRASREKGIAQLIRAFDRMLRAGNVPGPRPVLVYAGAGPQLDEWRALAASLPSRDDIVLTGYRRDAAALVDGATICVVPSVWDEAFGNAVLEAMLRAKPVIATRVGGVPELIDDGVTGVLVSAGDEGALATAMEGLLRDPERARRLGATARETAVRRFAPEDQTRAIAAILERGFDVRCAERTAG